MKRLMLKEFYDNRLMFDPQLEIQILTTDIVRQIGKYLSVDFSKIHIDQLFYGIKVEQKRSVGEIKSGSPNQMKNLVLFAKIALTHLNNNKTYYDDLDKKDDTSNFIEHKIPNVFNELREFKKTNKLKLKNLIKNK